MTSVNPEILWWTIINEREKRLDKLWSFRNITKKEFASKLNKNLDDFISGDLNDFQKEVFDNFMADLEPKLLKLKEKSEKPNLSISEIKDLLWADNISLMPLNIQEELKIKLKNELKSEISSIDSKFLDKTHLNNYLSDNSSIIDKVSFIENYLDFFNQLDKNQKKYLENYIDWTNTEEIKFLSLQTVEKIWIVTASANYAPWIIPTQTLSKFNTLTYEYTQTGVLDPLALQFYIQNEEWIRWIGKKSIQLNEVDTSKVYNSDIGSITQEIVNTETLIWIEKFNLFMNNNKNSEIFSKISNGKINAIDLQDFRKMESEFIILTKQIQKEYGYIPYDYLIFKSTLESVWNHLFLESNNQDTQKARKMLQFLDMCEEWMKFDDSKSLVNISKANLINFSEEDFNKIKSVKEKIKKWEITSFKDLEKENYITDSDEWNILQEYWNYLKDEVLDDINDPSIQRISENLWVKDDWDMDLFHISMEDLDKKLELIDNRNGNTLENLKLAQATDMISWNTGAKEQIFSFIESDIVKYLEDKEITTTQALQPNEEQVEAEAKNLDKQINKNVFLEEISKLSDAQKQQIIKDPSLKGIDMDYAVLDVIKQTALKQTAYRTLFHKNILSMVQDGNNLDGMHKVYMQKHDSMMNNILSGSVDIAETLIKEAIIFAITSVLTAWAGWWAVTSAKLWWSFYTNKIWRTINTAAKYAESGRPIGQKVTAFWLNTAKFTTARSFEAWVYTLGAGMMYENQEISLDSYITNLALFAGGITGMKVWEKIIPRNSWDFTKTLSQILWGSIGWTGALIMTEDFPDGLSLEDAWSMMTQWMLMGGLMFPLMKHRGLQNKSKQWWEGFANRNSAQKNRISKALPIELQTKILKNQTNTKNLWQSLWQSEVRLNNAIRSNNNRTSSEIASINSNTQMWKARKLFESSKVNLKNSVQNSKLKTVNSIKNSPDNAKLSLNKFLAENRTARLESLKKIDHTAKYNDLWNGFTLKNGKEIVNRDFQTVWVLPDWVKIQSVQYLNFWNKRIPTLEMSDWKILRLQNSKEFNGNMDAYKKILWELQSKPGSLEWIYNQKWNLAWYRHTENSGNIIYYTKNGNKSTKIFKKWVSDKFETHTLASNGKFTTKEVSEAGLTLKNKTEIKRNFDKAFEENFADGTVFKKTLLQKFEWIKNNPNATPAQKKQAGKIQEYLLNKPAWFVKGLVKKSLFATLLAWGWVLGFDYMNDGDIDLIAIWTGLTILFASSDQWLDMIWNLVNKAPVVGGSAKAWVEWLKKAKDKHKTLWFILRVGWAMVAMDYMDTKDNK